MNLITDGINIYVSNIGACEFCKLTESFDIEQRIIKAGNYAKEMAQEHAILIGKQVELNRKKLLALPGDVIKEGEL